MACRRFPLHLFWGQLNGDGRTAGEHLDAVEERTGDRARGVAVGDGVKVAVAVGVLVIFPVNLSARINTLGA